MAQVAKTYRRWLLSSVSTHMPVIVIGLYLCLLKRNYLCNDVVLPFVVLQNSSATEH